MHGHLNQTLGIIKKDMELFVKRLEISFNLYANILFKAVYDC